MRFWHFLYSSYLVIFLSHSAIFISCSPKSQDNQYKPNSIIRDTIINSNISKDSAIKIAINDAKSRYNISKYEINCRHNKGEWSLIFLLKEKHLNGGGPAYLIDDSIGLIKEKKYYQ